MRKTIVLALLSILAFKADAQGQPQEKSISQKQITEDKMEATKQEAQSFSEYNEVMKALQPYIESAGTGDGKLSRTAFFDHANIVGSVAGEFSSPNADEFAEAVSSTGPSENIQHHVAWIDISGPAAAARVEFINWAGLRFTDFFVLYKQDGQWKISGKVYDSHSNN